MALVGRLSERQALEKLLDAAAAGLSGVLVLRGEAGFGKTALLDAAAEAAALKGIQIARLTGVESETQLGYAGLHRLLLPYADHIDHLPGPQRDALRSTFGLANGPADRFMVALGVLTLLADVAAQAPLVCLVDDGHWLDPETQRVLGFVARRLDAEQVAIVLATRDMDSSATSGALPELTVRGLSESESRDLLHSVAAATLSPFVASRLIASAGGNPLALIELTKELTPDQLSGVSPLPEPIPVGHSLELIFSRQVNRLPPDSRLLIALAATEPSASQEAIWRAAAELGIDPDVTSSQAGDLVTFTPHVMFRHPMVGSVAHHLTPVPQRRRIHQALANVSEKPDRVAWHLAMAASGPDETVAVQLEDTAERARQRGGYAERVSFLAKAAELSVSPELRIRRLLGAAEAALTAGQLVRARALLDQAEAAAIDDQQVAAALRLSGMVSTATGHTEDAARQHLAAAKLLMPIDAPLARRTLLSALTAANYARTDALKEVTDFACDFLETPVDLEDAASTPECLLFGLVYRLSGSPEKAAPLLRAATDHLRDPGLADDIRMSEIHPHLGSIRGSRARRPGGRSRVAECQRGIRRRTGGIVVLPVALGHLSGCFVFQGRFDACKRPAPRGGLCSVRRCGLLEYPTASKAELALLCWRGREKEALDLAESTKVAYERRGDDARLLLVYLTPLELSRGRYREAYNYLLPRLPRRRAGKPNPRALRPHRGGVPL